jgi:ribosomal protein S18 acetylase RimI-like enzyme
VTREVGPDAFLALRSEVRALWPEASRQRVNEILPVHATREGFRAVVEAAGNGGLAGFAYGYRGATGQWWHDVVAAALGPEGARRWLAEGHFEFVELHVRRDLWGRGIGGRLHDALLAGEPGPAVLSTQRENERALGLYHRRGWEVIVPEIDFGAGYPPFCVLGKDLEGASENEVS